MIQNPGLESENDKNIWKNNFREFYDSRANILTHN